MYRGDSADVEASDEPGFTNLGLSKLLSLPGWRRRRQATLRAQLEEAEARLVRLEDDHARQVEALAQDGRRRSNRRGSGPGGRDGRA